jgi:ferric-dicitrate binding protein FerR (iron transport regulator)
MDNILCKLFDGSISKEELAVLSAWIAEGDENRNRFVDMYRVWNTIEFEKISGHIDLAAEFALIQKRIFSQQKRLNARRRLSVGLAAAACFATLLIAGTIWLGLWSRPSSFEEITVPHGEKMSLTLPDGTQVQASAGTWIHWPQKFGKKQRMISVDGQVYLDVAHDAARPFVVNTERMDVTVFGTEFGMTAYSREETSNVVLVSGSVTVSNNHTGSTLDLLPDQMYVYDIADGSENVLEVDTALHTSWLDGFYAFDKESFAGVLTRLSIYYGVSVECEPRAGEYLCSGKLNLKGGFEQVLAGLSYVVPITYTVENGVYRIRLSD